MRLISQSEEADTAAGGGGLAVKKSESTMTKRQSRKHVNPSNTWPQQPKIQSSEAREKANLRVAGLLTTKTPATKQLDPALDLNSPEIRYGRLLGATDQRKRHAAVSLLQTYLKGRCHIENREGGLCELDLLKLWKGLWYTLFLADKVPVQDELSKRIAKLIWCVAGTEEEDEYAAQVYLDMMDEEVADQEDDDVVMEEIVNTLGESYGDDSGTEERDVDAEERGIVESQNDESQDEDEMVDELIQHCRGAHLAALFVKTFFRTIQREWGNMDKHRVDKFYTLIRHMLHETLQYMAVRHWNRGIVLLFNDTLRDEVLFQVPNGLRFHLIDITVAELAKVNAETPMPLTEATFLDCLDPYCCMAQYCDDPIVHSRVMEHVFGRFLNEYSVVSDNSESEDALIFDQVHVGTVAKFLFELGSNTDTQERYRKPIYDMYKRYLKQLKKVGKDVVLEEESSCADEDQAQILPIEDLADDAVEEEEITPLQRKREETGSDQKNDIAAVSAPEDAKTHKRAKMKKKDERSNQDSSVHTIEKAEQDKERKEMHDEANPNGDDRVSTASKRKRKKKKKRQEESSQEQATESGLKRKEPVTDKMDKADNKKKNVQSSVLIEEDQGEDEVITISVSEQKGTVDSRTEPNEEESSSKMKGKAKKGRSKPTASDKLTEAEIMSEEKRVKFGRTNHCKSYSASMKALKNLKASSKTPERGILRSKSPVRKRQKKARSVSTRNRATDYF